MPVAVSGQAKAAKRCGSTHPPEQNLACLIRRHPAVLSRLAVTLRDGCEEFELDVVGISKDQHRGVGFVSNR